MLTRKQSTSFAIWFILGLSLFIITSCESLEITDEPIPFDSDIVHGVLENGLNYYILENDKPANRAELRLVVDAGSILEDEDQRGLAHFLEHMAFNGTELYPKNELISFLQSSGSRFGPDINAYTGFDETVYMLSLPTDRGDLLEKGLEVLEQWAFFITLNEQDIIDEKNVILDEWRLSRGAQQRIFEKILPVLFPGSLYVDRLPIGLPEIIQSADSETLGRFYKDWYRPELMAVIAVGDFDASEMEEMIRDRFSRHENPASSRPRPRIDLPADQKEEFIVVSDPEETVTAIDVINSRYSLSEPTNPNDYRDVFVERLFYSMINQRLSELVQKADPPFISSFAYSSSFTRRTLHSGIYMQSEVGGIERALSTISREYERIRRHGFNQSELDRARTKELSGFESYWKERDNREHAEYIESMQAHYLTGQPIPPIDWEWELIQNFMSQITLADFQPFIEERLSNENNIIAIAGPTELDTAAPTEEESFVAYRSAASEDIEPWIDSAVSDTLVRDNPQPGSILSEEYDEAADIYIWELSNGALVYAKPTDFRDDEILFSAFSDGGLSLVDDNDYNLALWAANIAERSGLGELSSIDFQKALTGKQVSLTPWISEYEEGLSGSASPDDLETLLQMAYLYFTDLGQDTESWEAYRSRFIAYLENLERNPKVQYSNQIAAVLFDNHPRALLSLQTPRPEDLKDLDYEEGLDIFRSRFANAGDFTFFFVGAFDPEVLKLNLEQWIASLPGSPERETIVNRELDYFTGTVREEVYAGIEPLSIVTMYWNGDVAWSYDTLYDISALTEALNIRLIELVREEIGGTYSIFASFNLQHVPEEDYLFTIQFSAEPERVQELIDIVREEIDRIIREGLDSSYAQKVSESQRLSYEENLERNEWWLGQIEFLVRTDLGWEYALEKTKWYDAVTANDIQNSAGRFFEGSHYAEILLFPEK